MFRVDDNGGRGGVRRHSNTLQECLIRKGVRILYTAQNVKVADRAQSTRRTLDASSWRIQIHGTQDRGRNNVIFSHWTHKTQDASKHRQHKHEQHQCVHIHAHMTTGVRIPVSHMHVASSATNTPLVVMISLPHNNHNKVPRKKPRNGGSNQESDCVCVCLFKYWCVCVCVCVCVRERERVDSRQTLPEAWPPCQGRTLCC